ncbi:hypothetical protein SprV_0902763200 [Sparganum proliferum]
MVYFGGVKYYTCTDVRLAFNFEISYVGDPTSLVPPTMVRHVADLVINISGQMNTIQAQPNCTVTVLAFNSPFALRSIGISLPFDYTSKNYIMRTIKRAIRHLKRIIPLTC